MLKSALANFKGTGADEARREQMNWLQRNLLAVGIAAGVVVLGGGGAAYWYIQKAGEAERLIDRERASLISLNKPEPLPEGIEASLERFKAMARSSDRAEIAAWEQKIADVRRLEAQLAPLDREVTGALRAKAKEWLDHLMTKVGKDAPNVQRWSAALDKAQREEERLRTVLAQLDTTVLVKPVRDNLKPSYDALVRLAPAGDPKVKAWGAIFADFDKSYDELMAQLRPLDAITGSIPQDRIEGFTKALDLIKPKLGDGDPQFVRWRDKLDKAKGYVNDLRSAIRTVVGSTLKLPLPMQNQIRADLKTLGELAGPEDADVRRWNDAIAATEATIKDLRQQLIDAFKPLAADDILPVHQIKVMDDVLGELKKLAMPGDLEVIAWEGRIQKSKDEAKTLDERLKRLEPTQPQPITLELQRSLAADLARLKAKGGIDLKREQQYQARLDAEKARVADLRRKLAVELDAVRPLTDAVLADLAQLTADAGKSDADVVRWQAKVDAVKVLVDKLAPLADENAIVPAGCQDLYRDLVGKVGEDDVRIARIAPRMKQVQEVEALLAPVDKVVPLPVDVATNLERSKNLFGAEDPVHLRRAGKVARVGALKRQLARLEAVVAMPATTLAADRTAFAELMGLVGATDADVPSYARRLAQLMGPGRPAWASASGRDEYGLWADVMIRDQRLRFRFCPPGRVVIGSPDGEAGREPDEVPVPVTLTKGVWIAESECTQALWRTLMAGNPSRLPGDNRPVERVSYPDVQAFLMQFRQVVAACPARLPTEVEWEYACRAGSPAPWSAVKADDAVVDKVAWFAGNAQAASHEVKLRFPNALGLYDMHGNVWEWCEDRFGAYPTSAITDWIGRDGLLRVVRGGSWGDPAVATRAANRQGAKDDLRSAYVGFRLAVDVQWQAAPDGTALLAGAPSNRKRVEVPLGDGKLVVAFGDSLYAIEVVWPEAGTKEAVQP